MEISYHSPYYVFHPLALASRHLHVAFSSGKIEAVQSLWDQGIVSYIGKDGAPSLTNRVKHILLALSECIIGLGAVIAYIDRKWNGGESLPPNMKNEVKAAVAQTPKFASYGFKADPRVHLSDLDRRPANLLYDAIFGKDPSTQPGSGKLFDFPERTHFTGWIPHTYHVTATHKHGKVYSSGSGVTVPLEKFLGNKTYRISSGEIAAMQASQEVWVSPLIPRDFYIGMKQALQHDGIVILPGSDSKCPTLQMIMDAEYPSPGFWSIKRSPRNRHLYYLKQFLLKVKANPAHYGFQDGNIPFNDLKKLTLYQVGSMIVKTEDYRSLVGDGYEIAERQVGENDAIRLISASGIRGFHRTDHIPGNDRHQIDRQIMEATFRMSLRAAGKGSDIVFPAVGMGVWGGDPDVYWRAFLDAVVAGGDDIEWIYINPGHQRTPYGKWAGYAGQEFGELLAQYRRAHPNNKSLRKIVNLYGRKTDLFLLAQKLKKAQPAKTVALFNASDPDVTLGGHVGEYVNNLCHASTTEENFAAAGTSGMGFEHMTGVLNNRRRIHQG